MRTRLLVTGFLLCGWWCASKLVAQPLHLQGITRAQLDSAARFLHTHGRWVDLETKPRLVLSAEDSAWIWRYWRSISDSLSHTAPQSQQNRLLKDHSFEPLPSGSATAKEVIASGTPMKIPFGSQGNSIELAIRNSANVSASSLTVEVADVPSWLTFTSPSVAINQLKPGESKSELFTFSVGKSAPVNKNHSLTFVIKSQLGESWVKELKIAVAPPERYELFQNYPNPFNPSTVVSYQLPVDSKVSLKVYDLLGREVATLVDGQMEAGYHTATFDASHLASGLYFARLSVTPARGEAFVQTIKMLLTK